MNKHAPYDLAQMQSLPLEAKERMATERIKVWFESWTKYIIADSKSGKTRTITYSEEPNEKGCYTIKKKKKDGKTVEIVELVKGTKLKPTEYIEFAEDGQVYVAFSGGKDSTVLADLCARFCKLYGYTLYLLFVNTGLEFPEIQKFVKTFAEWLRTTYSIEVVLDIVRPKMRFDEVIKEYGYPVISKSVANTVSGAKNSISKGEYSLRLRLLGVEPHEYGGLTVDPNYDYEKAAANSKFEKKKYKYLLNAPFDVSDKCCDVMKKKPAKEYQKLTGRKPITATMACESMLRESAWLKNGCNAFTASNPKSQPLSFWTEQDVLHYLKKYNIPYCSVYGEIIVDMGGEVPDNQITIIDYLGCYERADKLKTTGYDRTGCIFCMFGCHLEKEPNRMQRLKKTHPKQYKYCIGGGEKIGGKWQPNKEGLGCGKVLDYVEVKYDRNELLPM